MLAIAPPVSEHAIIDAMGPFSGGGDPERQANIAFLLVFLGIVFVGGLTIWLFYGATF